MAILLDDKAQEEVARRRAHGQDAAMFLRLAHQRCLPELLSAGWASRRMHRAGKMLQHSGDVALYVQPSVAQYAAWHDLTITVWRLGPITRLELANALQTTLELEDWARTHVVDHSPAL